MPTNENNPPKAPDLLSEEPEDASEMTTTNEGLEDHCTAPKKNERQITCIVCPNSCRLSVWVDEKTNDIKVTGYTCPRGKEYGINEYTHPVRMLITTMRIENGPLPVIPVRTKIAIPKPKLFEAIAAVNAVSVKAPIKMGQVIIPNVCGTGVDVIASRDMKEIKK